MNRTLRLLLAFLAGLLLATSFPNLSFSWAAWLAPGLMLWATHRSSGWRTFGYGYVAALGHYLTSLYWLVLMPFPWMRFVGYLATSGLLAGFLAAWCWGCWRLWRSLHGGIHAGPSTDIESPGGYLFWQSRRWWRSWAWALLCAAAWVAMEMALARALTGFPWNFLGVSQFRFLSLIQVASLTGVYGVSFCIVWASVTGFVLVRRDLHGGRRRLAAALGLFLPPLLGGMSVIGYGKAKLSEPLPSDREVKIALIQPAILQSAIWDANEKRNRFDKLIEISRAALATEPDLLVWPETAMPDLIGRNRYTQEAIVNLLRGQRAWIVMGGGDTRPSQDGGSSASLVYHNAAFLIDAKGDLMDLYHKRHLVPFGEYMPGGRRFPWLAKLRKGGAGITPGTERGEFEIGGLAVKCVVLICFEDVFPHEVRSVVKRQSDFLLNLTNNGWFGESAIQRQHAVSAMFRAVENGLPLVRCANNGLTCWIDARGRLHEASFGDPADIYQAGFKIATIPLGSPTSFQRPTLYHRYGDWFGWTCVFMVLASLLWAHSQGRGRA